MLANNLLKLNSARITCLINQQKNHTRIHLILFFFLTFFHIVDCKIF